MDSSSWQGRRDQLVEHLKQIGSLSVLKSQVNSWEYSEEFDFIVQEAAKSLIDSDKLKHAVTLLEWLIESRGGTTHVGSGWSEWLKSQTFSHLPINTMRDAGLHIRVANALGRSFGSTEPIYDVFMMLERGPDALLAIRNFGEDSLEKFLAFIIEQNYVTRNQLLELGYPDRLLPPQSE